MESKAESYLRRSLLSISTSQLLGFRVLGVGCKVSGRVILHRSGFFLHRLSVYLGKLFLGLGDSST